MTSLPDSFHVQRTAEASHMNPQETHHRLQQQEAKLGKIDRQFQRLDDELHALETSMMEAGLLEDEAPLPAAGGKLRRRKPR